MSVARTAALALALALALGVPAVPAPASSPSPAAASAKTTRVQVDGWRIQAGPPPAGWTEPGFDDHGWAGPSPGPFSPRLSLPDVAPAPGTLFDLVPGAPLLMRGRFAVANPARVHVVELAVAYADGFVAFLNGREIARRGLAPSGSGLAAAVPHGPEIERVTVPVPSRDIPSLAAGANLLAVAVYAYPGRSVFVPRAPAAAVDVALSTGVRFVRGPYLTAPFENKKGAGVTVVWQTDLAARGVVTVERADAKPGVPPRRIAVDGATTEAAATLEGLEPGAAYRYRVEVSAAAGDGAASGPARFETVPASPAPVRFAVYGDTRYPGHAAHRAVVDALVREAPAIVFVTGDLTDLGSEESNWQRYFDVTAPLGAIAPVVPALGNHDAARKGAGEARAWALFRVPAGAPPGWTSFDLGGVHFVILDSNEMRSAEQRRWLVEDLARAHRHHPRAVFAFCHEGPWSHALHGGERLMARDYASLLAAGHVDVLFSGHDHVYERGVGETPAGKLTYVVSGGGGAPLYDPSCAAPGVPGPAPGGTPLPVCPAGVAFLAREYHYVVVEVKAGTIALCPRRPDGSALEPCSSFAAQR